MSRNDYHDKENEKAALTASEFAQMKSSVKGLQVWLDSLSDTELMEWNRLPDIGLYMDQVLTLMDRQLAFYRRGEDDRLLTQPMINNYTKDGLLPRAVDKKYTQGHLALLSILCSLKPVLSIADLSALLKYTHIQKDDHEIYDFFLRTQEEALKESRADLAPQLAGLLGSSESKSESAGKDSPTGENNKIGQNEPSGQNGLPDPNSQDAYRQELALMALRMALEARVRIMMTQKIMDLISPPEKAAEKKAERRAEKRPEKEQKNG